MESNEEVVVETQNDTETTENNEELDVEALKKENATLKAQKEHWRQKAESKGEAKAESKQEVKEVVREEGSLSQKDVIYLAKADIHEDDVEEITKYAHKMGVSVKEAHDFYKPILKERAEERKTAQATQTKGGHRGQSKDTPEALLSKASKGDLPDDDDGIAKLARANLEAKASKK